jgi:hypothetical protein
VLVDRGIIRILDIAFMTKGKDGSVSGIEIGDLKQTAAAFAELEGASSGLLGYEDRIPCRQSSPRSTRSKPPTD